MELVQSRQAASERPLQGGFKMSHQGKGNAWLAAIIRSVEAADGAAAGGAPLVDLAIILQCDVGD